MTRLLSALSLLLCLGTPSLAASDCGSDDLTQTCLLNEAMWMSGTQHRGVVDILDMLAIAQEAERSGQVDMTAFTPRFFDQLTNRYPHGPVLLDLLDGKVCTTSGRGIGPVLAAEMVRRVKRLSAEVTAEDRRILGSDLDRLYVIATCLALAGDMVGLEEVLAAHPERVAAMVPAVASQLIRQGKATAARTLTRRFDIPDWETVPSIQYALQVAAIEREDTDALLDMINTAETQRDALSLLRRALYALSDPLDRERLLDLAHDLTSDETVPLSATAFTLLVRAPAQAGNWNATLALMARLDPSVGNVDATTNAMARLAGATGTWDVIVDLIETHAREVGWSGMLRHEDVSKILAPAFDAALAAGYGDLSRLLDKLEPADQETALIALGRAQIRAGDVQAGNATAQTLAAMGVRLRQARRLLGALAVALAKEGHTKGAVHYARQVRDPRVLARVAVHAPH